jgi:hypothetical protein
MFELKSDTVTEGLVLMPTGACHQSSRPPPVHQYQAGGSHLPYLWLLPAK